MHPTTTTEERATGQQPDEEEPTRAAETGGERAVVGEEDDEKGRAGEERTGPRATRLRELFATVLARTLQRLSWPHFAECYPTVAAAGDGSLLGRVREQMVGKMGSKCEKEKELTREMQREFEKILAARNVIAKLNELDELIAEAEERRRAAADGGDEAEEPVPPHTLPPQTILAAHMHPALVRHRSLVRARLEATQAQNALLADQVARQRAEVDALLGRLDGAVEDVRGAGEALAAVAGELVEEMRVDDEL